MKVFVAILLFIAALATRYLFRNKDSE